MNLPIEFLEWYTGDNIEDILEALKKWESSQKIKP